MGSVLTLVPYESFSHADIHRHIIQQLYSCIFDRGDSVTEQSILGLTDAQFYQSDIMYVQI